MKEIAELLRDFGGWGLSALLFVVIGILDRRNEALNRELRAEGKASATLAYTLADRNAQMIARVAQTLGSLGAKRG